MRIRQDDDVCSMDYITDSVNYVMEEMCSYTKNSIFLSEAKRFVTSWPWFYIDISKSVDRVLLADADWLFLTVFSVSSAPCLAPSAIA